MTMGNLSHVVKVICFGEGSSFLARPMYIGLLINPHAKWGPMCSFCLVEGRFASLEACFAAVLVAPVRILEMLARTNKREVGN